MLSLQLFSRSLQLYYALYYTRIRHFEITKDPFTIIDDFSLIVNRLIEFKQLFSLQCLGYLALLKGQRVVSTCSDWLTTLLHL